VYIPKITANNVMGYDKYMYVLYDIRGSHGGEDIDVGLLGSNFSLEDGSSMLLRNVGIYKLKRLYYPGGQPRHNNVFF
jgi:hypothetical protein